jgi:hypothetical protein
MRKSIGGKAPRKHVMHTAAAERELPYIFPDEDLPLVEYKGGGVLSMAASVDLFLATFSSSWFTGPTVHSWSGSASISIEPPPGCRWLGGVHVDRSDARRVLALAVVDEADADQARAGYALLCSIDAAAFATHAAADDKAADDEHERLASLVQVRSTPFCPRVALVTRDRGMPHSIAQIPGCTVVLTGDGVLWFFDDADHTLAPTTVELLAFVGVASKRFASALSVAAHGDRVFARVGAAHLFVATRHAVEFALFVPDASTGACDVPLALSPSGDCVVTSDGSHVLVFDVVALDERANTLGWGNREHFDRWGQGQVWEPGSFFSRASFALQMRHRMFFSDCGVASVGFVGAGGAVMNESATLMLMDTKKPTCNFPLRWWHATSDVNELYDEARVHAAAGKFVFFGSNGRTPETHDHPAIMRVHVADLVGLRARAFTIAVALQSLCLPAWITLLIAQAACVGSEFVPLNFVWQLVTKIKHGTEGK